MKTNQTTNRPIDEIKKVIKTFDTPTATISHTKADNNALYTDRNNAIDTDRKTACDMALMDSIAITATYSTLNFLVSQNATNEQTDKSIDAPKDEKTPNGYNMALKLLKDLPVDIMIYRTQKTDMSYSDSIDLLQEIYGTLSPFICSNIELTADTIVYTKTLKNGNEKNYTLFALACNTIRKYIQARQKPTYTKQYYIIGISDNGEQVTTRKRPKTETDDISTQTKKAFMNGYGLTAKEQEIIYHYINGLKPVDIAPLVNMTFEATKKALYRAKKTIEEQATANGKLKTK